MSQPPCRNPPISQRIRSAAVRDESLRELRINQRGNKRRLNPEHHVQKIVALSEIYGVDATARAMTDACAFQAFSCEYIANLLESRVRLRPEPAALQLTRRQDLLELEMPQPDLGLYQAPHDSKQEDV